MDELIKEFLDESGECIAVVEEHVGALRQGAATRDQLTLMYSAVHTVKGSCGFLGYAKLEAVTAAGEGLLKAIRDGRHPQGTESAAALADLAQASRNILRSIESGGTEGEADYSGVVAALRG